MRRLALAVVLLGACQQEGTISFSLAFPPGTTRLPANATTVRLVLEGQGNRIAQGTVAADGSFDISLSAPADGTTAFATFEALDAGGAVVARGLSGPLPIAAYDASFVLYVAPPQSFAEAPVALDDALADVAVTPLPYGALLAGGRAASGAPSDQLVIYNSNYHELQAGDPLPEARAALTAAAGDFGIVYLFGGTDAAMAPAADFWSFDTNVPPAGRYTALGTSDTLARSGADAARIGPETFVVTGDPPVVLDGGQGLAAAVDGAPPEARAATHVTAVVIDGTRYVVFTGATSGAIWDVVTDDWRTFAIPERIDYATFVDREHRIVLIGGQDAMAQPILTATRIDPIPATTDEVPALASGRIAPAVAVTLDQVIVAGGEPSFADAEVLDSATLSAIATVPLVAPRRGAVAQTLPTGNVLLAGGVDPTGAPVGPLELYTP